MFKDDHTVPTAQKCLEKCNLESRCKYWDFENIGICRLRIDAGSGPQSASGYVSGAKHCKLETSPGPCREDKVYLSGSTLDKLPRLPLTTAEKCLDKCNSESKCQYWNFGRGWCNLLISNSGEEQSAIGYSSGPKNCDLAITSGTQSCQP